MVTPAAWTLGRWHEQAWPSMGWWAVAASGAIHVAYSLVLQRGYQNADFSVVYPTARGTAPAITVIGAVCGMGEAPSGGGWLGLLLVGLGIVLTAGLLQGLRGGGTRHWQGLGWGALTGVCIAAYTLLDNWAIKTLSCPPLLYYTLSLACRFALLAPWAWQGRSHWRSTWQADRVPIVIVGVLSPVSYLAVLWAMQSAPLSYVAPLREVSMLVGVWLGAWYLRETQTMARLIGTVMMIGGVAVVACS
jgi:drug/metabolite transporter (DMT)-like permease